MVPPRTLREGPSRPDAPRRDSWALCSVHRVPLYCPILGGPATETARPRRGLLRRPAFTEPTALSAWRTPTTLTLTQAAPRSRERARQWRARATPEEIDALRGACETPAARANPATPRSRMDLTEVENARSRDRAYYHADRLHSLERQHRRRAAKVGADVRRVTSQGPGAALVGMGRTLRVLRGGGRDNRARLPLSRGGRHAIGNLIPACSRCNPGKGWKFVSEWKHGRTALGYVPPQRRGRRALRPIA